jgi:hypothetical protein
LPRGFLADASRRRFLFSALYGSDKRRPLTAGVTADMRRNFLTPGVYACVKAWRVDAYGLFSSPSP